GAVQGQTFEYSVAGLSSTTGNDGYLLSDGNTDDVTFVGGDDVIKDFTLGEDVLTLDLPGLNLPDPDVSTAAEFIAMVEAAVQVALETPEGAAPFEAYICAHDTGPSDLVLVMRDDQGVAQHSVKLIGLASEIGLQALQDAGAEVDAHDAGEPGHSHGDGPLVIEDNNAFLMAMGEGSRIEIHAADADKESWTQISQNAEAGDTFLSFVEDTGWEIGDVISIAPSGSNYTQDEVRIIKWVSADGKSVELDQALEFSHLGVIEQHNNGKSGDEYREYDVDMRAEVALLSRNVTIQGDNDGDGYGAHTMVMHGASQHISGAEFTRVGQIDELGRYPIHWHMGADVSGQYVENISIHEAYNKGITVHGSFNARVEDNVVFDHIGHGIFTEDGSEYGNQFLGNLVFGTHRSETGEPIPTDKSHVSSYWIENTNNTFVGNHAAGSQGFGFFVAPAPVPHGLSAEAYDREEDPQIITSFSNYIFEDNAAHSAATTGYWQDGFVRADDLTWRAAGASGGNAYIEDFTAYGNGSFGMWFRGSGAYITDSALADNRINYEFRGGRNVMHDTVVVGRSDTAKSEDHAGIPLAGVNSNEQYLGVVAGYDGTHWANYGDKIALSIRSAGST
ncbi:MAG: right-handed parallel beta-helix repeat-containing protein, partial [Pseudomonadota bacterium]